MEPTLHDGDILMVSKFEYFFTNPERGEVIVFPYKGDPQNIILKELLAYPESLLI